MNKKHWWSSILVVAVGLTFGGCATPSSELLEARRSYKIAKEGFANDLVPDKVLEARQALELAEKAHADDAQSFEERSYAYIASRKAKIAVAEAGRVKAEKDIDSADKEYLATQKDMLKEARQEVGSLRDKVAEQNRVLTEERRARLDAEKRLTAAMLNLKEVATVKEDKRGMVITLDSSVLFASGKFELLDAAQSKIAKVAKTLREQGGKDGKDGQDRMITVEGHTDSRGSAKSNLALSRKRAQSVRLELIEAGVKPTTIEAVGRGEAFPVATNATTEGRANNRRVEIVVRDDRLSS